MWGEALCGVGNGLEALHLILRRMGSGRAMSDRPFNTYIATWLAVTYAGARPIQWNPIHAHTILTLPG